MASMLCDHNAIGLLFNKFGDNIESWLYLVISDLKTEISDHDINVI